MDEYKFGNGFLQGVGILLDTIPVTSNLADADGKSNQRERNKSSYRVIIMVLIGVVVLCLLICICRRLGGLCKCCRHEEDYHK